MSPPDTPKSATIYSTSAPPSPLAGTEGDMRPDNVPYSGLQQQCSLPHMASVSLCGSADDTS